MLDPRCQYPQRDGFALVTSLLVIVVLSLLAVAAVMLSSTEKRTTFAESVHSSAVFAADAGGEAAINFVRLCDRPPNYIDATDKTVQAASDQPIEGSAEYDYDCRYVNRSLRAGWDFNYHDYNYRVASSGRASIQGNSGVQLMASRLFREGY